MANLVPVVGGQRRVFCCHRASLSGRFAPNSLSAIDECLRAAVPRLEIDVRFLADDAMLIFHDAHFEEDTTGTGPVDALDRSAVRSLRYLKDLSITLCFLEEVVELMGGATTVLQVDLKLMRPMTGARLGALAAALSPMRDRVLIGSQAHWNLRGLAKLGFRVAIDPTLQWHFAPDRGNGFFPDTTGVYGMWDGSPIAHNRRFSPEQYFEARIDDIRGLLPEAEEWMVDIPTIQHMANHSFNLGDALARRGVSLAAWTLHDIGNADTRAVLDGLFASGVTTVITDDAVPVAEYLGAG